MRRLIDIVLGVAFAGLSFAQGSLQSDRAQDLVGAVETLEGTPVANAVVALQPTKPGILIKANLSARTEADGSFRIEGVPEGEYRACVPWSETNVLDPCVWGGFPTTVKVTSEEAMGKIRLGVNKGVELSLHVTDTGRLLSSAEARQMRRPTLAAGVYKPGVPLLLMRRVNSTESQREYRLLVPAEVALTVTIDSEDFEFEEVPGTGKQNFTPVADSLKAQVEVLRGTARLDLRVRVKGTK